jgi:cytochrome c peroxidase
MNNHSHARWAKLALFPLSIVAGSAWSYGSMRATPKLTAPARAKLEISKLEGALCSPQVDLTTFLQNPQVIRINREIDSTEAALVARATSSPPTETYPRNTLLGQIILFDKNLSVNKNVACVTCHMPETGYTGASELINRTIVAYPGSNELFVSARKPQSYTYATYSPVLQFDSTAKMFKGGNFWDMRATGITIDNPAAEQALGPPVNPLEMANPDAACVVWRLATGRYRRYFESVWGVQSFAITWPANVSQVCSTPGPAPANDPLPVHLSPVDRGTAMATYNFMGLSAAQYEAAPAVTPFSSKFDEALANPTKKILTAEEQAGWSLFRGKGTCNTCHVDGTSNARPSAPPNGVTPGTIGGVDGTSNARPSAPRNGVTPGTIGDQFPLFTDFTAANLGLPKNIALRFYCENTPNAAGFTPNPAGAAFLDKGVGAFLRTATGISLDWARQADKFDGTFRVPTTRNVDMRPTPDFVKSYMHNGYLKSLKEVVHFYNTRDVLPRCVGANDRREKVGCWPAPEIAVNVDSTIGKLGLTSAEEDLIVAFMRTLTDGGTQSGIRNQSRLLDHDMRPR